MLNKVKEVHFKILHKIYPCKASLSKSMDIDNKCSFCTVHEEDLAHLFYNCDLSLKFWSDVSSFLFTPRNVNYKLSLKDVICSFTNRSKMTEFVVNFYILHGKYYIHKRKFAKCIPRCDLFLKEMESLKKAFKLIKSKKNDVLLDFMDTFFTL